MIKIIVGILAIAVPFIAIRYIGQLLNAVMEYYTTSKRTPAYFKTAWKEAGANAEECFWGGFIFVVLVAIFSILCWLLGDIIL